MVQCIRIHLPMQGTWVRALVWEDSTCCEYLTLEQLLAYVLEPVMAAPRPPKGCGWELVERGRGHLSTNNGLNRLLPSPRCGPQNSRPEESHTHWKVGPGPGPGPVPGIRRVSQGFGGGGGWDAISASSQLPLGTGTLQAPGHRPLERQAQLAERRALHPDRP